MSVIFGLLWPAFIASAVLGFGFTAWFGTGHGLPSARRATRFGALAAILAAGLAAWSGIVPGRPGLWLDIAVACALFYATGVAAAACAGWAWSRRPRITGAPGPQV